LRLLRTITCPARLLNSSTACFWMKQIMNCKGLGGQGGGIKPEHWSRSMSLPPQQMERYPIPESYRSLIPMAKEIDNLAVTAATLLPDSVLRQGVHDVANRLLSARQEFELTRCRMVAFQEELDWKVYSLYGLCSDTTGASRVIACCIQRVGQSKDSSRNAFQTVKKSIFYEVHAYRVQGCGAGSRQERRSHHSRAPGDH